MLMKLNMYSISRTLFMSPVFIFLFFNFQIELADVGRILKVRIGHDGKGMMSGWFLDKVTPHY